METKKKKEEIFKIKLVNRQLLTKFPNLLTNWITPIIWLKEFLIAIHRMDLCLNSLLSSTDGSKRVSKYASGIFTVYFKIKI